MAGGREAIHCSGRDVAGRRTFTELGIKEIKGKLRRNGRTRTASVCFLFTSDVLYCTTGYLLFPPMKEEEEEEDLK